MYVQLSTHLVKKKNTNDFINLLMIDKLYTQGSAATVGTLFWISCLQMKIKLIFYWLRRDLTISRNIRLIGLVITNCLYLHFVDNHGYAYSKRIFCQRHVLCCYGYYGRHLTREI